MQNVGNSFSLPFRSKNWLGIFAIQGLIGLIPIVGQMALYGWTLRQLDQYRQGRDDLVPAGFHLSRGVNIWVVSLIWSLPSILVGIFAVTTIFSAVLSGIPSLPPPDASGVYASGSTAFQPAFYAAIAGMNGLFALSALYGLVLALFIPAIWLATERGGIAGGLNPALVWSLASRSWSNVLIAAICIYAGHFLGALGIIACCVGIIFTIPYGYAVMAAVLRYYEHSFESPPAPTAPTAYAPT